MRPRGGGEGGDWGKGVSGDGDALPDFNVLAYLLYRSSCVSSIR
jgi:hypothetical protein